MNKVVVVTGGSRGIGAATAVLAGAKGYDVCVNYHRDREAAARVVRAIEAGEQRATAVQADVSEESGVVRVFEAADALGTLVGLVNNAGILEQQMRVETMGAGRLQRVLATNVIGPFLCAREAIKRMSTSHGGHGGAIVNVSSAASFTTGALLDVSGGR